MRPRIRSTAHTSSRHALRACSVPGRQHISIIQVASSPAGAYANLLGTVAVPMAPSPYTSSRQCCLPYHRHTNGLSPSAGRASQGLIHRDSDRLSEVLCHCVAPVLLLFLLSCPLVQRRQGAFSATRPANQPRCGPAGSDEHELRSHDQ